MAFRLPKSILLLCIRTLITHWVELRSSTRPRLPALLELGSLLSDKDVTLRDRRLRKLLCPPFPAPTWAPAGSSWPQEVLAGAAKSWRSQRTCSLNPNPRLPTHSPLLHLRERKKPSRTMKGPLFQTLCILQSKDNKWDNRPLHAR